MNVGKLKKLLEGLPDSMPVCMWDGYNDAFPVVIRLDVVKGHKFGYENCYAEASPFMEEMLEKAETDKEVKNRMKLMGYRTRKMACLVTKPLPTIRI